MAPNPLATVLPNPPIDAEEREERFASAEGAANIESLKPAISKAVWDAGIVPAKPNKGSCRDFATKAIATLKISHRLKGRQTSIIFSKNNDRNPKKTCWNHTAYTARMFGIEFVLDATWKQFSQDAAGDGLFIGTRQEWLALIDGVNGGTTLLEECDDMSYAQVDSRTRVHEGMG